MAPKCEICGNPTTPRYDEYTYFCAGCGFWMSSYQAAPDAVCDDTSIGAEFHEASFGGLRSANWNRILDALDSIKPLAGAHLCDIGCAYGGFLSLASRRGASATGIEPNKQYASAGRRSGLEIREGFFPQCLQSDEVFDILTFHDVLEHIPGPKSVLLDCKRHLSANGLLAITIPTSRGSLYRTALAFRKVGIRAPFERLWQRHFYTPHVSYFNAANLERLLKDCSFELLHSSTLESVRIAGLWSRLKCDNHLGVVSRACMYAALAPCVPLLRALPSDILFQIYRSH
jgi:2-polyprenyl-3-methyl-5-hydroxy-6-metoxy-1,4-benzoquinol methylase